MERRTARRRKESLAQQNGNKGRGRGSRRLKKQSRARSDKRLLVRDTIRVVPSNGTEGNHHQNKRKKRKKTDHRKAPVTIMYPRSGGGGTIGREGNIWRTSRNEQIQDLGTEGVSEEGSSEKTRSEDAEIHLALSNSPEGKCL